VHAALWVILVAAFAACSQPDHHQPRPDLVFDGRLGDRDHPTEITVDRGDFGDARATAPAKGTWWYRIVVSPRFDATSKLTITARNVTNATQPTPGRVRVDVLDGATEISGIATGPVESEVVIADRAEPIAPLLVRVTTTGKARFRLTAMRRSTAIAGPPRQPPCDHYHIDPSNPNCAGVSPHCNLDEPDFNNPDCCQADCELGARRCRAKVTSGGASAANIAIGTSKHIMRNATGILYQRGMAVSEVLVLAVKDDTSFVQILSPAKVDEPKLVENGEVVLLPPAACRSAAF
jgi:hypothetical protein